MSALQPHVTTPTEQRQVARPPPEAATTDDVGGIPLPVYENLLGEALGRRSETRMENETENYRPGSGRRGQKDVGVSLEARMKAAVRTQPDYLPRPRSATRGQRDPGVGSAHGLVDTQPAVAADTAVASTSVDDCFHRVTRRQQNPAQRRPAVAAAYSAANISIEDYLLPAAHDSRVSGGGTDSATSTLRRRPASPVYVNDGHLLHATSRGDSATGCAARARRSRSRSLSSGRGAGNRTLTAGDQFGLSAVQQRLSFVSRSPSPPQPPSSSWADPDPADADWDDRLSTLSLGCRRRPPVAPPPDRRDGQQRQPPPRHGHASARRRLVFDHHAAAGSAPVDRRPEAVEESVRPLYRRADGPSPTISNVPVPPSPTRNRPTPSVRLFPGLADTEEEEEESVYETIAEVLEASRLRNDFDAAAAHLYDNIDDLLAVDSIRRLAPPPPVPPPPLPARRPVAAARGALCRDDVVELDSQHVYTVADVLDSFAALAAHLPRAQRFVYDLQTAAYLHRRQVRGLVTQTAINRAAASDHATQQAATNHVAASIHVTRPPTNRAAAADEAGQRWTNAAAKRRGGGAAGAEMTSAAAAAAAAAARRGGPSQRRRQGLMMSASGDDIQPIVVDDYVCSPGNCSSGAATQADRLRPGCKAPGALCGGGGRSSKVLEARPQSILEAPRLPTKKTGHVSRSSTELDRYDDDDDADDDGVQQRGRRRSSKPFQMPPESAGLPVLAAGGDISRHRNALSRSLMDGIGQRSSRPASGQFADRKQNSRVTLSSTAAAATGRDGTLLGRTLDARRPADHRRTFRFSSPVLHFNDFYRAMLCFHGTSHGPVSVCLCLSVCVCLVPFSRYSRLFVESRRF